MQKQLSTALAMAMVSLQTFPVSNPGEVYYSILVPPQRQAGVALLPPVGRSPFWHMCPACSTALLPDNMLC